MKPQPLRTCLGCRERFPRNRLLKFVLKDGTVIIDSKGTGQGRSAYCCKNKNCMLAFLGKNKSMLLKAFRVKDRKISVEFEDWGKE